MDISKNTALKYLVCWFNDLTDLDVTNNTALKILRAYGNELANLDVSNNLALTELMCGDDITSLDVTNNSKLTSLECGGNQLANLDISKNKSLWLLDCASNQLSNLDLAENTGLAGLFCSDNLSQNLNVVNDTALQVLWASGNLLNKLNLSNNHGLIGELDGYLHVFYVGERAWPVGPYIRLDLGEMPTLNEVCVWETFNPDSVGTDTIGNPHVYFTTECTTGLIEYTQSDLGIYPNPVNDFLFIETNKQGLYAVELYSLSGQLLYSTQLKGSTHQINLSSFQKGIYLITVKSKDFIKTEKIIKR